MSDASTQWETGNSERVGFCQDCGRPLTRETIRTVGSGVFCEPCLEVRLAATAPAGAAAGEPVAGTVPPVGGVRFSPFGTTYPPPDGVFPPIDGSKPHPVLAALLGLIPGVGAMYNGQFAKGIAHIVIFALLDMLADHGRGGIFGLLVTGWVFYQAFDAYHTAKARRDGTPLPDPFGLNHIGDHFGVKSTWPHTPAGTATAPPDGAAWTAANAETTPQPNWATPPPVPPVPAAWGSTPVTPGVAYVQSSPDPIHPTWAHVAPPAAGSEWVDTGSAAVPAAKRFPAGAAWLIGLGVLFCIINFEPDWHIHVSMVVPFFLIGLGVWIFVRRMSAGGGLSPASGEGDGYAARTVCSLRAPIVLITVGVLTALQAFDVVRMHYTWPVLIIMLGLLMLLERSLGARGYAAQNAAGAVYTGTPAAAVDATTNGNHDGKGV